MDPMTYDEDGKDNWTLRVRCKHLLPDWAQCTNIWQSCRGTGSSSHVKCLNWWGGERAPQYGGSAHHTPCKCWVRSLVRKRSAVVLKRTQMRWIARRPLRLAVPRRLPAFPSLLIEHHSAPLQTDVIRPEARYLENACESLKIHCLALPFRWGVPAAIGNG